MNKTGNFVLIIKVFRFSFLKVYQIVLHEIH